MYMHKKGLRGKLKKQEAGINNEAGTAANLSIFSCPYCAAFLFIPICCSIWDSSYICMKHDFNGFCFMTSF